ncbi:MAG: putative 6-phospho-beta-glucosidase [Lentisphaerae bacterium ADurb.BinA184]|nr:MAG: putative 6-phospho-beta-glucosidase [Lentisphaerae bacterium ADurb.BinA184]
MRQDLTIAIVGAGSSYTPELIAGILEHSAEQLPITGLRLADPNRERLAIMAGLTQRMLAAGGRRIRVGSDVCLERMLDGADFVITQIRVGGMAARHLDESIPARYGLLGQETTGPGGLFKALRSVPAMLDIARAVERVAPQAFILNYTNPSGIVTEAVLNHSNARIIGLCSGMPAVGAWLREHLREPYPDLRLRAVGLNHFGFYHRLLSGGREVTGEAIGYLVKQSACAAEGERGDPDWLHLSEMLGAVPMWGYSEMYFRRARRLRLQAAGEKTRAQEIMAIEQDVFAESADPNTASKPAALSRRGGGGYSQVTFDCMKAILGDLGTEVVVSARNGSAVESLPASAAVEVVCRIGREGAVPLDVGAMPLAFRGLVQAVKAYETLAVEAAVTRSRRATILALLNHPLVGDLDVAEPLADEMFRAHGLNFGA